MRAPSRLARGRDRALASNKCQSSEYIIPKGRKEEKRDRERERERMRVGARWRIEGGGKVTLPLHTL